MKRWAQRLLPVCLVAVMVFVGLAEAIPAFAASATDAILKKCKPVITEVVCENAQDSGGDRESVWYEIHVDMPNYDNIVPLVYFSDKKDGTYRYHWYYTYENGVIRVLYDIDQNPSGLDIAKTVHYMKVQFCTVEAMQELMAAGPDQTTLSKNCTKMSDPYELPAAKPWKPFNIFGYRTSATKIYLEVGAVENFKVHFQIRKKGTSKWENLSTSKLVKRSKITNSVTLTVKEGENFEFRARYYYKYKGKAICGKYAYGDSVKFESTPQVKILSALQFDSGKEDNIALFWDQDMLGDDTLSVYDGYFQVAYRKAGSKDKWKTFKIKTYDNKTAAINDNYTGNYTTKKIKVGYEYRVRLCLNATKRTFNGVMPTSYGKYSKTFTVTKSSAQYRHAKSSGLEGLLNNDGAVRPKYDTKLSRTKNMEALEQYLDQAVSGSSHSDTRLEFCGSNGFPYCDVMYHNGKIGVTMVNHQRAAGLVALETMRFFSQDEKLAAALFAWQSAAWTFGHANSDYFGFTDVKWGSGPMYDSRQDTWSTTQYGGVIDRNGTQVEAGTFVKSYQNVERADFRIFWFDEP